MAILELSNGWLGRLISFLWWANCYFYTVKHLPDRSPEWCSRVVTLLHGFFGAVVGYHQCGVYYHNVCRQFSGRVRPMQYALMLWSWGYFAFDLLWCLVYWPGALLMLCHHVSSLAAVTIYMYQDYTGCTFACTLALMEITNPLLQIRWFLKQEGYADTYLFTFIEVLYLTMFIILRGVLGSYFLYWILKSNHFCREHKIISLILYIVSIAFLYDIIGYILYKYNYKINIGYIHYTYLCNANSLNFYEYKIDEQDRLSCIVNIID